MPKRSQNKKKTSARSSRGNSLQGTDRTTVITGKVLWEASIPSTTFSTVLPINLSVAPRLLDQVNNFTEFRFVRMQCKLWPAVNSSGSRSPVVVGYVKGTNVDILGNPSTLSFASIYQSVTSRFLDSTVTVPQNFSLGKADLLHMPNLWCAIGSLDAPASELYQGNLCIATPSSATTLTIPVEISYTVQFRGAQLQTTPSLAKQIYDSNFFASRVVSSSSGIVQTQMPTPSSTTFRR